VNVQVLWVVACSMLPWAVVLACMMVKKFHETRVA